MSSVEDYRQRLATLQGSWDTLSLLSHLSGDGTDIGATRQAFETLATDLVARLAEETHHKSLLALKSKSQIAIDVLVRNLFERTADIGFLATDGDIRGFASRHGAFEDEAALQRARAHLQRRFREYVAKYSVYDDVILLAPNGNVLARLDERHAVSRCTDSLLDASLTSRAPYVETFAPSSLFPDGARKLIYSYRVVENDRTLAVLCLCFKFDDEVAGIFCKLREASDWTVFAFLDERGHVLASSDPWQVPPGAVVPLACEEGRAVLRFAGREYLAITRRAQGYQGYMGPGWYGHAMIPLEHAFERDDARTVPEHMLADLRDSDAIFSAELRAIPAKADAIQRELNRAVWNGNARLAQRVGTNNAFAKVLLWEIGNAGRRTQHTFERSTGDLQATVVSAILEDAQQLATLAVDVLDRNLYERMNDCRWWALTADLIAHLESRTNDPAQVAATLRHINSLYTVYHDIVLFDAERRVRAVSNPQHEDWIGETISESWAAATLALRTTQDFSVSPFAPSKFYDDRHTLVFGAAVRNERKALGGVGIVFDTQPQLAAMLRDALPRTAAGDPTPGCIGLFVDDAMRIVASTAQHAIGAPAPLPRDLLANASTGRLACIDGTYYAVGAQRTSGYREYKGLGVTAIVLIPLGPATQRRAAQRKATRESLLREAGSNEQVLDIATFRCGEQWLGLLRDQVVEAVDGSALRAVPGAPAWHAGLLMHRGVPVPVVDLARFVGSERHTDNRDVVIARASNDSAPVGLLIDELDDIPEIAASRILPVSDFAQRGRPSVVDRAVRPNRADDPVLFIVNLDQLLMHTRAFAPALATATS